MSRGLGRMQRFILDAVNEPHDHGGRLACWLSVVELAGRLDGSPPSRATVESVRRAAKTLAKAGQVELRRRSAPMWPGVGAPWRNLLVVHAPFGEAPRKR